ncbi:MAG: hypothetical protein Q9N34_08610 [Aquificota bacterium]|nr:hypothetical protein [Aquificota bacterium]
MGDFLIISGGTEDGNWKCFIGDMLFPEGVTLFNIADEQKEDAGNEEGSGGGGRGTWRRCRRPESGCW